MKRDYMNMLPKFVMREVCHFSFLENGRIRVQFLSRTWEGKFYITKIITLHTTLKVTMCCVNKLSYDSNKYCQVIWVVKLFNTCTEELYNCITVFPLDGCFCAVEVVVVVPVAVELSSGGAKFWHWVYEMGRSIGLFLAGP